MTRDEQVRIATAFAETKGIPVDRYKVGSVRMEGTTAHVLFVNDTGAPGDHFTVTVDAVKGAAVGLMPGR